MIIIFLSYDNSSCAFILKYRKATEAPSEKNVSQPETFILPLAISVQSSYWFCLKLHMILWMERVFILQPNQAWLGRAISAVMKSAFQARSAMVRSPALQPFIKETFPPLCEVCQHHAAQSSSFKLSLSVQTGVEILSRGLSSLARCQLQP